MHTWVCPKLSRHVVHRWVNSFSMSNFPKVISWCVARFWMDWANIHPSEGPWQIGLFCRRKGIDRSINESASMRRNFVIQLMNIRHVSPTHEVTLREKACGNSRSCYRIHSLEFLIYLFEFYTRARVYMDSACTFHVGGGCDTLLLDPPHNCKLLLSMNSSLWKLPNWKSRWGNAG